MPTFDQHRNLVSSIVAAAPNTPTAGTSLVVTSGSGSLFPATPFNCIVYSPSIFPTSTNAEIVRVTSVSGDTLTIARTQEGSVARAITVGDVISLTITAKTVTDLESAINNSYTVISPSSGAGLVNTSLTLGNSNARYMANVGWQFYNPTTGLWYTLLCTGNPPLIGWDAGQA